MLLRRSEPTTPSYAAFHFTRYALNPWWIPKEHHTSTTWFFFRQVMTHPSKVTLIVMCSLTAPLVFSGSGLLACLHLAFLVA